MNIQKKENVYPIKARNALEKTGQDNRTHEQKIALENLTRHTELEDLGTIEEISEELSKIESLKEKHVYRLIEVMPQYESSLRAIFSDERIRLDDSQYEKILDICQSTKT